MARWQRHPSVKPTATLAPGRTVQACRNLMSPPRVAGPHPSARAGSQGADARPETRAGHPGRDVFRQGPARGRTRVTGGTQRATLPPAATPAPPRGATTPEAANEDQPDCLSGDGGQVGGQTVMIDDGGAAFCPPSGSWQASQPRPETGTGPCSSGPRWLSALRPCHIIGMPEACSPWSSQGNQMARMPVASRATPIAWPNGLP